MNEKVLKMKALKKLISNFNQLNDDAYVKVKISFLLDIMKIYDGNLFIEENMDLANIIIPKLDIILSLIKMEKKYINIRAKEAKQLVLRTMDMDLDRFMIIVWDFQNNKSHKNGKKVK